MDQKVLGIDWGQKYIGLAVYDPRRGYFGLDAIENKSDFSSIDELRKVVCDYQVTLVVLGATGRLWSKSKVAQIKKILGKTVPVVVFGEYLSSKQAEIELREANRVTQKKMIHSVSAEQILREYIESMVSSEKS